MDGPGVGGVIRPRTGAGAQLERSLDECRGRIDLLHARLDDCGPTVPVRTERHPDGSVGPRRSVPLPGPRGGVDDALTAIAVAAHRLLDDLAGVGGHSPADDAVGDDDRRSDSGGR